MKTQGPQPPVRPVSAAVSPSAHVERFIAVVIVAVAVAFGGMVLRRSAFSDRRRTDAVVYFRAAWAVRAGEDLYSTTANNWHYHYPPLLAILMTPLADPPAGADRSGVLPFPVSIGIWYGLNALCAAGAAHWLALAAARVSRAERIRDAPRRGVTWWHLRLAPILLCMPMIGLSLSRGQANLIVLMLLAGMMLATARGQRFRAGLWLAAAACIKVFPAFLLVYPL